MEIKLPSQNLMFAAPVPISLIELFVSDPKRVLSTFQSQIVNR